MGSLDMSVEKLQLGICHHRLGLLELGHSIVVVVASVVVGQHSIVVVVASVVVGLVGYAKQHCHRVGSLDICLGQLQLGIYLHQQLGQCGWMEHAKLGHSSLDPNGFVVELGHSIVVVVASVVVEQRSIGVVVASDLEELGYAKQHCHRVGSLDICLGQLQLGIGQHVGVRQ
jgi:hypothetical protein